MFDELEFALNIFRIILHLSIAINGAYEKE